MSNIIGDPKDWWTSYENWIAFGGGVVELINWLTGSTLPNGVVGLIAMIGMVLVRNLKTARPIKQFNLKLSKENK